MSIFQLMIMQVVTFIALVLVLRKLLYSETGKALKRLQLLNKENEKKAEELKRKNEEAERQYLEKIRKAEEEVNRYKELARMGMEQEREKLLQQAQAEAEKIITMAKDIKEAMRREIAVEMEEKAVDFAVELLQEALNKEAKKEIHKILLSEMILDLEKMESDRIKEVKEIEMISAYSVPANERKKIEMVISSKANRKIDVQYILDEKIIAGAIIKIGNLILDGSISNRLEQSKEMLKRSVG